MSLLIVPTLQRGNSSGNAPALRDAGASKAAFQRWSVGTISRSHAPRGNAFAPRCGARRSASLLRSHAGAWKREKHYVF